MEPYQGVRAREIGCWKIRSTLGVYVCRLTKGHLCETPLVSVPMWDVPGLLEGKFLFCVSKFSLRVETLKI